MKYFKHEDFKDERKIILLVCKMTSSSNFYNLPSPSSRERVQWRRGSSSENVSLASPTHWSVISLRFVRVRICGLDRRFESSVTSPGSVLIHPWCCLWCWRSRRRRPFFFSQSHLSVSLDLDLWYSLIDLLYIRIITTLIFNGVHGHWHASIKI